MGATRNDDAVEHSTSKIELRRRQQGVKHLFMKRRQSGLYSAAVYLNSQLMSLLAHNKTMMKMDKRTLANIGSGYRKFGSVCKNSSFLLQEDPTKELPKSLVVMYCQGCQSYSYTGRSCWHKLEPKSLTLLGFLLRRIGFHIRRLQLKLINAWFAELSLDTIISVALDLQYEAADGSRHEKVCTVMFQFGYRNCPSCSDLVDEAQLSSVVQIRQHGSNSQSLDLLELRVLQKRPTLFNIKKIKHMNHGIDFFFDNVNDALTLNCFLGFEAPVKSEQIRQNMIMSGDTAICQSCITVTVCPIRRDDLVYLPSKVLAALGVQGMGPLVICTNVSSVISFLDPFKLSECGINANDYWREPFEPLTVSRKLVEYIVVDMEIVLSGPLYSLANARVALVSGFGYNDTNFLVKTHLGNVLKPGDYAIGYHLNGASFTDVKKHNCMDMLPDVVLIKKKYSANNLPYKVTEKKVSPEYGKFLVDLEKNPEAVFNLSLNGGDDDQNSDMASVKPEIAGTKLENLLAHLDLSD